MTAAAYVTKFADNVDAIVLGLYDEFDELLKIRNISTVNGAIALFREQSRKWELIAQRVDADPFIFEDLVRSCDGWIFRDCSNTILNAPRFEA